MDSREMAKIGREIYNNLGVAVYYYREDEAAQEEFKNILVGTYKSLGGEIDKIVVSKYPRVNEVTSCIKALSNDCKTIQERRSFIQDSYRRTVGLLRVYHTKNDIIKSSLDGVIHEMNDINLNMIIEGK
jgi:hypothetical protein